MIFISKTKSVHIYTIRLVRLCYTNLQQIYFHLEFIYTLHEYTTITKVCLTEKNNRSVQAFFVTDDGIIAYYLLCICHQKTLNEIKISHKTHTHTFSRKENSLFCLIIILIKIFLCILNGSKSDSVFRIKETALNP